MIPKPGSPADRVFKGLPSGRTPREVKQKGSCKCAVASCAHCRNLHSRADGSCSRCGCRGFL